MSIQSLPPDVVAQIKSSTIITNLNGVVQELMKNSLDASCTKIDISVDYIRGGCVVEDDGVGIPPVDFGESGGLGKMYHTSKFHSTSSVYGHQGIFISALSAVALVSITSRHSMHRSVNTLNMHKSEAISRQTPAPAHHQLLSSGHGSKITVRDLFGNMPVRVKQRAMNSERTGGNEKEWDELKRLLVLILLSWPSAISLSVRNTSSNQQMVCRNHIRSSHSSATRVSHAIVPNVLFQAGLITEVLKPSWVPISASTNNLELNGTASLDAIATRNLQFISFGIHPLVPADDKSIIQEEINRLFLNSAFGNEEVLEYCDENERKRRSQDSRYKGDGFTNRELKGTKKGVDRWPMFYIQIRRASASKGSARVEPQDLVCEDGAQLSSILELLRATLLAFLTKYHFRPAACKGHRLAKGATIQQDYDQQSTGQPSAQISEPYRSVSDVVKGILNPPRPDRNLATLGLDLLGTNIRLPSFHQNLTLIPDYDNWSGIKSGSLRSKNVPSDQISQHPSSIKRPASSPSILMSLTSPATSLFSKTGKLIRPPFVQETGKKALRHSISKPLESRVESFSDSEIDPVTTWVNPTSRTRTVINSRTGHSVSSENMFLRRSEPRRERLSSRSKVHSTLSDGLKTPWIDKLLSEWQNPVFQPTEPVIPQVSFQGAGDQTKIMLHGKHHHCGQDDIDRIFQESSAGINGRISKSALRNAEVVQQVDNKFILLKINCLTAGEADNAMLAIIDQHAADERIRVETLLEELCNPSLSVGAGILSRRLEKPIIFEIAKREVMLLRSHQQHFAAWGILYDVFSEVEISDIRMSRLEVKSLPPAIIERCKSDPRILIDLIRSEAWKLEENKSRTLTVLDYQPVPKKTWLDKIHGCPQGLLDMINSRACRSAIMFNDELSLAQCEVLIKKLADCKFPFQCAHGRPSMVPLVNMNAVPSAFGDQKDDGDSDGFVKRYREWRKDFR